MEPLATEIRHLRLVLAIDETRGLRGAAERLHLTASALSQQLRELETRLGGPLFHREWRRMTPTAAGRRFIELARVIVEEVQRAEGEIRALARGASGSVRLTSLCHHSYRWLPPLLRAFADEWPQVEVSLVVEIGDSSPEGLGAWLRDRRIDVALTVGGAGERRARVPGLRTTTLFRDDIVAVVGRGHPWFGRSTVAPEAFADVHYCGDPAFLRPDRPLGRALASAGVAPRKVTAMSPTAGAALELARANLGVTVMARWALAPELGTGELHAVRIRPPALRAEWMLVTRDETPEPALAGLLEAFERHRPIVLRSP